MRRGNRVTDRSDVLARLGAVVFAALAVAAAHGQAIIRTVAGDGAAAYSGDGGLATSAAINHSRGLAIDVNGNMYIADTDNSRIRRVTPTGMISTFAGNGTPGYSGDGGLATAAELSDVMAVAVDPQGNVYIADASNRRIRKVTLDGRINTIAGIGVEGFSGDGGPAISAMIGRPVALAFDGSGNLYFADSTNQRIRKITTAGTILTVAGNGVDAYSGDGGQAVSASLGFPIGIAFDPSGNLYVADGDNNRVRKITPGGIISTVAGNGQGTFAGDGGQAASASINIPSDVAVDSQTNLYIADAGNNRVRKVDSSGTITTVAGTGNNGYSGDGSSAVQAMLNYPWGLTTDQTGGVYIADRVNNRVRFIAGNISIQSPFLTDNSAVNGATFAKNVAIAPGAIVTIFGQNLSTGTASASGAPLPTNLAGTSVTFNGVPAPLFYVSPGQINAQAPFNLGTGIVKIQVMRGNTPSPLTQSNVAAYSPGIFIINPGTGEGAVLHASDNTVVGSLSPAHPGEYISIYATGLGAVTVPVASGTVAPSAPPLAQTTFTPTVLIANQPAAVSYSGLAPGFIGLYQINVIVPASVPNGYQPIQLNIGGYASNTAQMVVAR